MKRRGGKLVPVIAVILALAGTALFFLSRPPVLIVTDVPFAVLYGPRRILTRQIRASAALFRLVRPVLIAEGAGPDVLVFAIEDAASQGFSRPFCVLIPARYAESAWRYREQFPGTPVALLEGRSEPGNGDAGSEGLFEFSTDRETDLYRAGIGAAVLDRGKRGKIPVFQDRFTQMTEMEAFRRGLRDQGSEAEPLFPRSYVELANAQDISCVILAGSGTDYLDQNPAFPVMLFTWLDPEITAKETVIVFDDSPWALAVPAVKMIAGNQTGGRIPSDILIISERIADKDILRQLKNALRGSRQKPAE